MSESLSLLDNVLMGSRTTMEVSNDEKKGNTRALARIKVLFPHCPIALLPRKLAFTMAEILLSLTIIGVVAAITLPSLTGNINKRTWNTQRKALYARLSQALALLPSLNGYATETIEGGAQADGNGFKIERIVVDEYFLTEGLSKVMKINNICDEEHMQDCGMPQSFVNTAGSTVVFKTPQLVSAGNSMLQQDGSSGESSSGTDDSQSDSGLSLNLTQSFETMNGESIALYYNYACSPNMNESSEFNSGTKVCVNFIYDLNGSKGPNTIGKDMGFITAFYATDPVVVAPMPLLRDVTGKKQADAGAACKELDSEARLPNREELIAMWYNKELLNISSGSYWSSSVVSSTQAWSQNFANGMLSPANRTSSLTVRCVKR